ncbi:conserved domain protein [Ruminococcus sp. CAG:563]|nr:conserved domain protein [Ruminococcus sp. CAG:563]
MLFIFFFPAAQAFLTELLPIPDAIKFLCDGFLVLLLLKLFSQRFTKIDNYSMPFVVIVGLFFFITLVGYLFNYQSVFYYLWGLRNNTRMFVAFFAFAYLADWEDAKGWIKALDVLFVINFAVVILQYFSGYGQDYIGGIFGTSKGCNGSLLIFLCIVFAKTILSFMRGEEKMSKCIFVSVASLLVSTLSELKMFFILFILILFMASFMTAHSIKKTLFFAFGAVLVVLFSTLLTVLYKDFMDFLSFDSLIKALTDTGYATDEDIGRFTALPVISQRFLPGFFRKLFGLGLGNCDSSSLSMFNTPFFESHQTVHYSYFSYAFLFLETGFVGLALYASFFVASFFVSRKLKKLEMADEFACQMSIILSVISLILLVYNSSLRMEIGFMLFFVLALPIISANEQRESDDVYI